MIYSFDGGSEQSYNRMRPGRFEENTFEHVYGNIRRFAEIRDEMGSPFPFTKIQMILTEETYHEQDAFFELFQDFVDDVSVKAYTERGGKLSDLDREARRRWDSVMTDKGLADDTPYWWNADDKLMVATGRLPCEQPYQRLMIAYDGRVSMCCYDWGNEHPIGYVDALAIDKGDKEFQDVADKAAKGAKGFELLSNVTMPRRFSDPPKEVTSLSEIWHSDAVNQVRRLHGGGRIGDVAVCAHCPFKDTYAWEQVDD
jgi:hypothetical protein